MSLRGDSTPVRSSSPTSASAPSRPSLAVRRRALLQRVPRRAGARFQVHRRVPCSSSVARPARREHQFSQRWLRFAPTPATSRSPSRASASRRSRDSRSSPSSAASSGRDAEETIMAEAQRADAVALGPGLGRSAEARALVARLLERLELPVVVDADALFRPRAGSPRSSDRAHTARGRAGASPRLRGGWIDAHRLEAARAGAEKFGAVVLLKGAGLDRPGPARRRRSYATRALRLWLRRGPATFSRASWRRFSPRASTPSPLLQPPPRPTGSRRRPCRSRRGSSQAMSSRRCRWRSPERPAMHRTGPLVASKP